MITPLNPWPNDYQELKAYEELLLQNGRIILEAKIGQFKWMCLAALCLVGLDIFSMILMGPNWAVLIAHPIAFYMSYFYLRRGIQGRWERFWQYRTGTVVIVPFNRTDVVEWIKENVDPDDFYVQSVSEQIYVFKEPSMAAIVKLLS